QRGNSFGDQLTAAVDQARLLGAVLERAARDLVVVGLVGLTEIRRVGVGDRALGAHPVQRGAGIETAGERDADALAGAELLKNVAHWSHTLYRSPLSAFRSPSDSRWRTADSVNVSDTSFHTRDTARRRRAGRRSARRSRCPSRRASRSASG